MSSPLEKEFKYFLENQEKLTESYNGQFVVIKDCKVLGAYSDELEAISQTAKVHEVGTFLVQKCEPGSESYTCTYHSRVAFH